MSQLIVDASVNVRLGEYPVPLMTVAPLAGEKVKMPVVSAVWTSALVVDVPAEIVLIVYLK